MILSAAAQHAPTWLNPESGTGPGAPFKVGRESPSDSDPGGAAAAVDTGRCVPGSLNSGGPPGQARSPSRSPICWNRGPGPVPDSHRGVCANTSPADTSCTICCPTQRLTIPRCAARQDPERSLRHQLATPALPQLLFQARRRIQRTAHECFVVLAGTRQSGVLLRAKTTWAHRGPQRRL